MLEGKDTQATTGNIGGKTLISALTVKFDCWEIDGTQYNVGDTITVNGNITIKAVWVSRYRTVNFDAQGHGTAPASQEVLRGNKASEPTALTATGYSFGGWYMDSECQNKWNFNDDTVKEDMTLYAKWTVIEYAISYALDGGTNAQSNPSFYTVDSETISLSEPTRTGYRFNGWTWEGQTTPNKAVTIAKGSTGNRKYTADWEILQYTVKFMNEDGTQTLTDDQTINYGGNATKPNIADPVKEGYRFMGWGVNGEPYDFSNGVTGNITLTPIFSKLYTISRGGYFGNGTGTVTADRVIAVEGETVNLTATPNETSSFVSFAVYNNSGSEWIYTPCTVTGTNKGEFEMPAHNVLVGGTFEVSENLLQSLVDTGNADNYVIDSVEDLLLVAMWMSTKNDTMSGKTITLNEDIDVTGSGFNGLPGTFERTFDGNNHTISGLDMSGNEAGFFKVLKGTVKDLTLSGSVSVVNGSNNNNCGGGIAVYVYGTVQDCVSLMNVSGSNSQKKGGIAGTIESGGSITGCLYLGIGGTYGNEALEVVGTNNGGTVADCMALYAVTGNDSDNEGAVNIESSESEGKYLGYFKAGSNVVLTLTADEREGYTLLGFKYKDGNNENVNLTANADGTYTLSNIAQNVTVLPNYSYNMGLSQDEQNRYLVKTADDLKKVAEAVITLGGCLDMTFLLANDIDLKGSDFNGIAVGTEEPFYGTFDGGGHTIANMKITSDADFVGFIGNNGGTLTNLMLRDCNVTATGEYSNAGMLTGTSDYGTLSHCRVFGGMVTGANAGAVSGAGATEDNLYTNDVAVISGGEVKTPGECGTSRGDLSYSGSNAAVVGWTVSFRDEESMNTLAEDQLVPGGSAASRPDTPTKALYTFIKWQRSNGTEYTFDNTATADNITANTTLYAVWEKVKYTVTVKNNDSVTADNPNPEWGSKVTLSYANLPEGYEAVYSVNGSEISGNTFIIPACDAEVTVRLEAIEYTITYHLNGGSANNPASYTVEDSVTLTEPTMEGYTFTGWTGTGLDEATKTVTITAGSTGDRTYTATWTQSSWIPSDENTPEFAYHSLILSGQIGVIFQVYVPEGTSSKDCYVYFDVSGDKSQNTQPVYPFEEFTEDGNKFFGYKCFINSAQMADEIHAELHYGGDKTLAHTYTAKRYLDSLIADTKQPEDAIELGMAIKDYGSYVQPILAEENHWEIGKKHAKMDAAYDFDDTYFKTVRNDTKDYAIVCSVPEGSGIKDVSFALVLDSETAIEIYLTSKDGYTGTVEAHIGTNTTDNMAVKKGSEYVVSIGNISAHLLGREYTVNVATGDVNFDVKISALSYVQSAIHDKSETMKRAVTSLYRYWKATRT